HIGPGFVSVQRDPSLMCADPGALRGAAGTWSATADRLVALGGNVESVAHGLVGTSWLGLGALAYQAVAAGTSGHYALAAGVVGRVSLVLEALAADIEAAVSQAEQAERQAASVNVETAQLNSAFLARQSTVFSPLPFPLPTAAESSQAALLAQQAGQARATMDAANQRARNAWRQAAAAFDSATAASPTVRAAVADAKAKAEAEAKKKQGGGFLDALKS